MAKKNITCHVNNIQHLPRLTGTTREHESWLVRANLVPIPSLY